MKPWVVFVIALAAVGLSACGSSSDSSSEATTTATASGSITKEEWIVQADEVCSEINQQLDPLDEEVEELAEEPETPEVLLRVAELLREGADATEEEVSSLRSLEVPDGDEDIIDSMLSDLEETPSNAEEIADAFEEGETSLASELADEAQVNASKARGQAQGYGLQVCGDED